MNTRRKNRRASLVIRVLTPGECSAADLQSFAREVRQGGQVSSVGLEARIAEAAWLGFAWLNGKLAGVAALKTPRSAYRSKVFSAAQVPTLSDRFAWEFGWLVVETPFRQRGLAKTLLSELVAKNAGNGIFATTRVDNQPMQRILQNAGFEVLGQPFRSSRSETTNCLWVRSASSGS